MTVDDAQVFNYRDEVIVELQSTDEYGALEIISYQFSVQDDRSISPKGRIEDDHVTPIREVLEQEGLDYADPDGHMT